MRPDVRAGAGGGGGGGGARRRTSRKVFDGREQTALKSPRRPAAVS